MSDDALFLWLLAGFMVFLGLIAWLLMRLRRHGKLKMNDELNARYDPMTRDELIAECERLRMELAELRNAYAARLAMIDSPVESNAHATDRNGMRELMVSLKRDCDTEGASYRFRKEDFDPVWEKLCDLLAQKEQP